MSEVRALLRSAEDRLAAAGVASPGADAAILLAHVLGVPRGRVAFVGAPTPAQRAAFEELVARRSAREPLQHLTGVAGFRHVELQVGPGVFVPRPETELLAGWAIERARRVVGRPPVVVDLCTGSGAIARSVADEVPGAEVHAVELDEGAWSWAARNLAASGVELHLADMAEALPGADGTVDVVVCNPPYIPVGAWESVATEARDHDPALALWSGEDGLDAVRVLERTAARLLRAGGWLGTEHADEQGHSVPALLAATGRWT